VVNTVSKVFVKTYENIVRHYAQQTVARLRPFVMEKGNGADDHNWERVGTVNPSTKSAAGTVSRAVATPVTDTPFSRRVSQPTVFHVGDLLEQEDPTRTLIDPNSAIGMAQGYAMRRGVDDRIIAAATGTALDGDGNANAVPAGQILGDYGATALMSFDLVTAVTEKFMSKDIDPDEPKVFVIGPTQARKLLQIAEATNADFNALRPLQARGYVDNWMGYSWVVSTRLLAGGGAGTIDCFAMTRRAIGLQVNRDIWTRVAEDPTVSFAWRIYAAAEMGAVRVEDEHLVWLKLKNSLT
jgi:hypothetical protein